MAPKDKPDDRSAPVCFDAVFDAELRERIATRRSKLADHHAPPPPLDLDEDEFATRTTAHGLVGLALGGGGVRAATFNLGLLQALAKHDELRSFDYVSSVGGGGYASGLVASLLQGDDAKPSPEQFPLRFADGREREEVVHARHRANFLLPAISPFRVETWRLISSYLGGLFVSLATWFALIALVSVAVVWLYPKLFDLMALVNLAGGEHEVHHLWRHPLDHYLTLLLPTLSALTIWVAALALHFLVSTRSWRLENRERLEHVHASALAVAIFGLGVAALPVGLVWLRSYPQTYGTLLGLTGTAAFALLRVVGIGAAPHLLSQQDPTDKRLAKVVAWLKTAPLIASAWAFVALLVLGAFYTVWYFRDNDLIGLPQVAFGCLLVLLVVSLIEMNSVSLFSFYRDRLARSYLVTRANEQAPVVENHDLCLRDADTCEKGSPYPLLCATLNANTGHAGAEVYMLSPLYCGSTSTRYQRTEHLESGNIALGSAMAASGAATSPLYGPSLPRPLRFLAVLLNIRLCFWTQNPNRADRPTMSRVFRFPYYYTRELFSGLTPRGQRINVTDGCQADNLGLYELLRRRCKTIVVSDTGEDPAYEFQSLGEVLRSARIHLGAQIELDTTPLVPGANRLSKSRLEIGTIHYQTNAGEQIGQLIYVKPCLVLGDPPDLAAYGSRHPTFPHEASIIPSFSAARFESYRELGYRTGKAVATALTSGEFSPPHSGRHPAAQRHSPLG